MAGYLEQSYNYYTISLFVVYGTIWNRAFGDEHYPEIARVLEKSYRELLETYCHFFARDGSINMWARSICYRLWVSGGLPVSFMLKGQPPIDPGWARRLCSGSLLQFTTREDFYDNDIPSLGFYGTPRAHGPKATAALGEPLHHVPSLHQPRAARRILSRSGPLTENDGLWGSGWDGGPRSRCSSGPASPWSTTG